MAGDVEDAAEAWSERAGMPACVCLLKQGTTACSFLRGSNRIVGQGTRFVQERWDMLRAHGKEAWVYQRVMRAGSGIQGRTNGLGDYVPRLGFLCHSRVTFYMFMGIYA